MVHQVLAKKKNNEKKEETNLKILLLVKNLKIFKKCSYPGSEYGSTFFLCGSRIRILIRIKIKWILSTDQKSHFMTYLITHFVQKSKVFDSKVVFLYTFNKKENQKSRYLILPAFPVQYNQ